VTYSDSRAGRLTVLTFHENSDRPVGTSYTRRTPTDRAVEIISGLERAFVRDDIRRGREVQIFNSAGQCVFHSKDRVLLYPATGGLTAERFEAFWESLP